MNLTGSYAASCRISWSGSRTTARKVLCWFPNQRRFGSTPLPGPCGRNTADGTSCCHCSLRLNHRVICRQNSSSTPPGQPHCTTSTSFDPIEPLLRKALAIRTESVEAMNYSLASVGVGRGSLRTRSGSAAAALRASARIPARCSDACGEVSTHSSVALVARTARCIWIERVT
jgi:hypothetical protein